ncbi:MAG: hypothetical protein AB8U53_06945 [Rickettsia aeschlimannii]
MVRKVADFLPIFAEVNIGIDYIELILFYILTKLDQNDIIEIEKILKSQYNIAKNLIKAGVKTDLIATSTGLKNEEVEKLK